MKQAIKYFSLNWFLFCWHLWNTFGIHTTSPLEIAKTQGSLQCSTTFFINSFYNSKLPAKCPAKKSYHLALCLSVYFAPILPPLKLEKATTYVTFNSKKLGFAFPSAWENNVSKYIVSFIIKINTSTI